MRPDCRNRMKPILGRAMMREEEVALDRRMRRAVKHLKATDPAWGGMTKIQRLDKAAAFAADSFEQDMAKYRHEVPPKAKPLPENVRQAERDRQQRAIDQGYTIEAVRGVRFIRGNGTPSDGELTGGRWFTDRPETANTYSGKPGGDMATASMKVRLRLRNPLVVDAGGKRFDQIPRDSLPEAVQKQAIRGKMLSTDDIADAARLAEGDYDGIIFKNLKDDLTSNAITTKPATVYTVFDRKNIRSEFAQFDPEFSEMPGLLFQSQGNAPTFYSALTNFVASSQQPKAPAAQWKAILSKAPGVKAEEIEWTGVNDWLDAQDGSVTREDLVAFLEQNGVQVEEVVKGAPVGDRAERINAIGAELLPLIEERDRLSKIEDQYILDELDGKDAFVPEKEIARIRELDAQIGKLQRERDKLQANDVRAGTDSQRSFDAQWGQWTLPGGENYREMLLTLPEAKPVLQTYRVVPPENPDGNVSQRLWSVVDDAGTLFETARSEQEAKSKADALAANSAKYPPRDATFTSSHWSEPNVLAHVRFKERVTVDGQRTLALEEIQSDWHQEGRQRGYKGDSLPEGYTINPPGPQPYGGTEYVVKDEKGRLVNIGKTEEDAVRGAILRVNARAVPNAPFKNNAWVNLVLKRMIRYAAENGFDSVSWIPGNIQNGQAVETDDNRGDFYDKIIPNLANKLGKKYGAKVGKVNIQPANTVTVENMGGPGWQLWEGGQPASDFMTEAEARYALNNIGVFWSLPITDELRSVALEKGFSLFQDQKRASVQIPGVLEGAPGSGILSDRNVILRLSNAADKTSFLHESAHIFLELYGALESQNEVIAERMAEIRKWLKLEEGAPLTVQQHELFAEAFEAYLMEGKSPNAELRGVFQKFRAWFTEVYRHLRGRLPKLDQEARDIFDRMLATEEEIEVARSEYALQLSSKMSGIMTPEQVAKYKDYAEKAGQVAQDKLFRKFMDQVKKRARAEYKADKARIEALVRKELESRSVYRALNDLSDDGKTLREGVDPDIIAPDYGYATGDELLAAIKKAPKFENAVKAETKRRMDELHGDMLTDGTAEAEAIAAVFNEPSIKAMEAERDALAEKAARDSIPLKAIRARAEQMINSVPIDEIIKPGKYAIKARDLHKRAIRAAAKEQWDDALRYTHQAMLQHELARRAYKAREEIGKINRYLGRYAASRKLDPKKIDPRYIAQIRNLTGLPGADNQQDTMQKLRDFADREANEGNPVSLPLDVTMNRPMPIRRRMTMDQLRDFRDGVKALVYQGRANSAEEKARFNAEVEALAQVIRDNYTGKTKRETRNPTGMESMGSKVRELEALFLRYPFLVEALQGGKDGVVVETLEQGLRRQLTLRNERRRQMGAQLVAILDKHGITQDELNKRISAPAIESGPVKFEQVLALALNMGTESNRDRLANDPTLGDMADLKRLLSDRLEQRHWNAVQDIWNLLDTLWPEAKAVEQRVTGGTPKKVDASPVMTKFGSYPGGYYPLAYDRGFLSNKDLEASDMKDLWKGAVNGMATHAATNKGFLEARQETVSRPLKLSLDTIITHIDDVTNDIYMREETINISRILRHTAFKEALAETHGSEYGKTLETVVKRVVHGTERAQDGIEKLFRTLRVNASVAILGLNVRTALLAPISYFQTVLPRYGAGVVLDGMASFYGNGFHAQNFITGKSAFMRERFDTLSREAHERIRNAKRQSLWNKAQGASYWLMSFVEIWSVSGPTWMGVYRDALAKGKSEADAITDADRAVATTQGSGLEIDQSILQGGNELQRSLTFMWGYVSGYYGVVRNDIAKEQGYRKTWPIVKHLVLLNIAASLMEAFLRMATGGDDEDPYLAAAQDMYWRNILGMLPGVSLAANRYGGAESPAISTGQDLFKSWRAWERVASDFAETGEVEGDVAYRAVRQTAKSIGIAMGVPGTVQIDKMINTLIVDDDPTPYELLFSGPDKDN